MQNRTDVIEQAAGALESGQTPPPYGKDARTLATTLREANQRGGFAGFAAYKTAQRVLSGTTA
ncbi:hypothetical protein OG937_10605 [Streptomyces sp. NBC_00510]